MGTARGTLARVGRGGGARRAHLRDVPRLVPGDPHGPRSRRPSRERACLRRRAGLAGRRADHARLRWTRADTDRDVRQPTPGGRPMIPRYTRPEMGAAWSDEARFAAMLRVELAVARAQARRGLLPRDAYAAIAERAHVDVDRIAEIERTTEHDVIAFVSQVA